MTFIFITLGLIVVYFVIASIKEGEARETIERERRANNKKIANLHFENLVSKESERQKILKETRKIFIKQLEKEDGIYKVAFDDKILIIVSENNLDTFQANKEAKVWIDTLMPSTGVDIVKIYNRDGVICGLAERNNENLSESNISSVQSANNQDETICEFNEIDEIKYRINTMFYSFCFSGETAKTFLKKSEIREQISRGLMASIVEEKNIIEKIFKVFLKKKYDFNLGESSYGTYRLNGYEFYLDKITIRLDEINTFFEVFYNDFEDVKDEKGNDMAIAKEFILYVKNFKPKAIFVLVYDPILQKYAIRRVFKDSTSVKLIFIENNDGSDCIDFLKDYVSKNNF